MLLLTYGGNMPQNNRVRKIYLHERFASHSSHVICQSPLAII
jgi:hypothetical protein